jgi:hypothetical protein
LGNGRPVDHCTNLFRPDRLLFATAPVSALRTVKDDGMSRAVYLVFGDLHGRILPAFQLALAWQREHDVRLDGLLQVGDLGYFPDPSRLDKATRAHAKRDPLELGAQFIVEPNRDADEIFGAENVPEGMWFIPGNHEDYDALLEKQSSSDAAADFPVDYSHRVHCIRDGAVANLPGGLRVGGLWGIDDEAPLARRSAPKIARIRQRSATQLLGEELDVLLTHDSPRDAVFQGSGSNAISSVLQLTCPAFSFFGHYHTDGHLAQRDFGTTEVVHLHGLELRGPGSSAEDNSVGVLLWDGTHGTFDYLRAQWLRTFTRHNWRYR